jgi:hypothetical protein
MPVAVCADDSSAELGAGGLVLTRSADIRLVDEDLHISSKDVAARFTFVNEGRDDIDTVVAFPLPDINTSRFSEEPLGRTTRDPVNFVGFTVSENGRTVPFRVEQRAFYNGRDVSDVLRRAGVPLNVVDPGFSTALDGLPTQKLRMLEMSGLVDSESGSYPHPHWTVRTKFWWTQHFARGRAVVLDEHYHPVTGQSLVGREELDGNSENGRYWTNTYCIDAKMRAAAVAMLAHNRSNPQSGNLLTALSVDYVLSTGNNWKGPIGHFRLVLDKLLPTNALSLCWDGTLTPAGTTRFESARKNFAPKDDIRFLILQQSPL